MKGRTAGREGKRKWDGDEKEDGVRKERRERMGE